MLTDIHSHILHNIDDGPENFEQSVELLNKAIQKGVQNIIATPHFYASRHSLNDRLQKAEERYKELIDHISKNNIDVSILKGFEVRYFDGISHSDSLLELSINRSGVLLLELEPSPITEKVVDEILNMNYSGCNVILAHIERYIKVPGFKHIKNLIAEGEVISQCNASSFISGSLQRATFKLLKENMVSVIAGDMHSVDIRPPKLKEAYEIIERKFGLNVKNKLIFKAEEIFNSCLEK